MMRFLRKNAELITGICVVLSLLLGGALLYLKSRADAQFEVPVATVAGPSSSAPPATAPSGASTAESQ